MQILIIMLGIFFLVPTLIVIRNSRLANKTAGARSFNRYAVINSAVLFTIAYNIIFFLQELFLVLGKNYLGLTSTLYHNNHNWEGSHYMESLAQGSGAVSIFLAGFFFLILQIFIQKQNWLHLLSTWLAFNGLMQSLPQFAMAMFAPETDTGQAFQYLDLSATAGWIFTIISLIGMGVVLVSFSCKLQQYTSGSNNRKQRFSYLKNIVLYAGIMAIVLLIPFRIPPLSQVVGVVLLMLISLPGLLATVWYVNKVKPGDSVINHKILFWPILIFILILVFFQGVLAKGIVFTGW